jgi:hypothetical protein
MKAAATLLMVVMIGGCATGKTRGWVVAAAWAANYTDDFIYDYWIQTTDGKRTGVNGTQASEFHRGGKTGGHECCGLMPGVGQSIKVVWRVGGRQEKESEWRTYSRDVIVQGTMPKNTREHSIVVVRFFPGHEAEAELLPGDGDFGPSNPRLDRIFFVGPRVMRQKGE